MAAPDEETLESLLTKATNSLMTEVNWSMVTLFCERVKRGNSLAPNAIRLLAHKMQSPVEREALYSLLTLEECAKVCGRPFHAELGKFRFLNEMIKIVSPKYLGNQTSDEIKDKCIDIMYNWTRELRHEPKILEAYDMLKKQGIVKSDPLTHDQKFPERRPDLLFKDEQSSKTLEMLLKSKHPDDLQAANRLIKLMVKQDIETTEKKTATQTKLEIINNNIQVLTEMMSFHRNNSSRETENDVMLELYHNLENERPKLFRLASEFDSTDRIDEILEINDKVMMAMNEYKLLFPKSAAKAPTSTSSPDPTTITHELLEFPVSPSPSSTKQDARTTYEELGDIFNTNCNLTSDIKMMEATPPIYAANDKVLNGASKSNFDALLTTNTDVDSLLDCSPILGSNEPTSLLTTSQNIVQSASTSTRNIQLETAADKKKSYKEALAKLDQLGQDMIQQSLSKNQEPKILETKSLNSINVPIETIDPASSDPLEVFSSMNGFCIVLHYGLNKPREDVTVYALSMTSKCKVSSIESVNFTVNTSNKYQLVKLQSTNQNRLPAFNPILPPQAISQDPINIEFNLNYCINEQVIKENGSFQISL